jgi:chromosome segregation ATPase
MATSTSIEDELKAKRADYKKRMERVKEREEALKVKRQELQERLVQFYKYIQDNEIKRLRATKKANAEESAKKERYERIVELNSRMETLEHEKKDAHEKYLKFQKYETYLNEVLTHPETASDEYLEPRDIIARYRILDDNRNMLKRQKNHLERMLDESKVQLSVQQQRSKNESVDLQNQVSELQHNLDQLQQDYKIAQDNLEGKVTQKSSTTKEIGQVRMACQNLYDRCHELNAAYRGGGGARTREADGDVMLQQLQFIGECLEDYMEVIREWKARLKERAEREKRERDEAAGIVARPGAAGGTAGAPGEASQNSPTNATRY